NSYELLLQELKVLFLQTRNNSHALYWAIIKETHNHQTLVEAKSKGIIARAGYFYNSLRDKFNKSLKDLVKAYKAKYTNGIVTDQQINEFIDEGVWQEVLSLSLDAADIVKINKNAVMLERLGKFVREFHLKDRTNAGAQIRTLDYLTVDLPIPSSYSNVVAKLNVSELACATKKNKRYIKK
ncbi:7313_t:CDS:2, partial [Paraglomus brasilianum]